MEVTENNIKTAREILDVIEKNGCTLKDVSGIFRYIENSLVRSTRVQVGEIREQLLKLNTEND